jgi:hypothetical protein
VLVSGNSNWTEVKFPEGTVAGLIKQALAKNASTDVARFENIRTNWTVKEVDRYSSAFAFGLLNAGYKSGDSIVLFVDQTCASESFIA